MKRQHVINSCLQVNPELNESPLSYRECFLPLLGPGNDREQVFQIRAKQKSRPLLSGPQGKKRVVHSWMDRPKPGLTRLCMLDKILALEH